MRTTQQKRDINKRTNEAMAETINKIWAARGVNANARAERYRSSSGHLSPIYFTVNSDLVFSATPSAA